MMNEMIEMQSPTEAEELDFLILHLGWIIQREELRNDQIILKVVRPFDLSGLKDAYPGVILEIKQLEGVKKMAEMPVKLEVERLHNLITGFGWTIQKQEVATDQITLTIVKSVAVPESAEAGEPA